MKVNQKELILLPYPFSNQQERKVRPALIISNNEFNKKSDDCIAVPLTSVIKEEPYSVFIEQEDLSEGKLLRSSRIRIDKIFSIDKKIIIMKIGIIKNQIFAKIKIELGKIF